MKKNLQNSYLRLIPFFFLALLAYLLLNNKDELLQSSLSSTNKTQNKVIGKAAQDFTIEAERNITKVKFQLTSLKGYPIVLHFWATWCGPCVLELPELLKQAQKLRLEGYSFIAISLDKDWATVQDFFRRYPTLSPMKDTMVLLLDPHNQLAEQYGVIGVPETFLINQQFLIDNKFTGPQNWSDKNMNRYWEELKK